MNYNLRLRTLLSTLEFGYLKDHRRIYIKFSEKFNLHSLIFFSLSSGSSTYIDAVEDIMLFFPDGLCCEESDLLHAEQVAILPKVVGLFLEEFFFPLSFL